MTDDVQLLRRYAEEGSEAAFADLVRGHVDLVYSAALRWTAGDAHLAQDVAQSVFTDLARKARSLPRSVVLSGWLYQATRYAAAKLVRTERRRVSREQEAVAMQTPAHEPTTDWDQISPHLDEAMGTLPAEDRDAVLLRFFERKEFREVGLALGASEEAARKRVTRALEKLRAVLVQKGVPISTAALSAALVGGAVESAPAAIVTSITTTAVAGAATSVTALTAIKLMSITNLKLVAAGAAVVAGLTTPLAIQYQQLNKLRAENSNLQAMAQLVEATQTDNARLRKQNVDADELDRLRGQNAELLRLRGEVNRLRNDKADAERLRAENAKLREGIQKFAALQATATPATEPEDPERVENIARMNRSRQWALSCLMFAADNNGMLPQSFENARPYRGADAQGIAEDEAIFELLTSCKLSTITNAPLTVLLREKEARRVSNGKYMRTYAFVDGHSEILSSSDGDYSELERRRGFVLGAK